MMQKDVIQTWFFNQPSVEVWKYLTEPEFIGQWLMKNDFKPLVGHKFQFIHDSKIDAYCQVLEIISNKRLSYSWRKGPTEKEITVDSVVTWTLTDKDGGTELLLQHNGFTLLDDSIKHDKGWNYCLSRMAALLNSSSDATTNA
jgi:uncharacterized protein YndB with AHSA1/START domain